MDELFIDETIAYSTCFGVGKYLLQDSGFNINIVPPYTLAAMVIALGFSQRQI